MEFFKLDIVIMSMLLMVLIIINNNNIDIDKICVFRKFMIVGNCCMCFVEVQNVFKFVVLCVWFVQFGMVVKINLFFIYKVCEGVMEFLFVNYFFDCFVCDQGGECDFQDQLMCYGVDCGWFYEIGGKCVVEDKNIGFLIKMSMNRCIYCMRCICFFNDIVGVFEMGLIGCGNDIQIGIYFEQNLDLEMLGNVIDLCFVGVLILKLYVFWVCFWELKKIELIDVLDGLGFNIRVDLRGLEVMCILFCLNDDVNEEWINDKICFVCDGFKMQRLMIFLVCREGKFELVIWEQVFIEILYVYQMLVFKENEFKVIVGVLIEVEFLVVMKDFVNKFGLDNFVFDIFGGSQFIVYGVDVWFNYFFNFKIWGIEFVDCVFFVGINFRYEVVVLNVCIRK